MNVQELYDAALFLVRSHNEAIGAGKPGFVDEEKFIQNLKLSGATTPEALKAMTYEDFLYCLPEAGGMKPFALARAIAEKVRGTIALGVGKPIQPDRRPSIRAERMTPEELVQAFDPEEPTSPVADRLLKLCRKQAFIIYKTGREVDVERTIFLLKEVKGGYSARTTYEGKRVYKVGELPDNYADENPFYPGRPLRPDGSCDQLNRSWQGIPKPVRQFIRFALNKKNGIDTSPPGFRDRAHGILDMILEDISKNAGPVASSHDGLARLRSRHPEVSVAFDEAELHNELPNLMIALGQPVAAGGPGNPFQMAAK